LNRGHIRVPGGSIEDKARRSQMRSFRGASPQFRARMPPNRTVR
jgi:hypothetical protein